MSILGITEKYSFITYGKKIILLVSNGEIFLFFRKWHESFKNANSA
jgi:hypothetical protein